jgi:aminocarboxymuconate-semialdehyde decarboxylase
MNAKLLQARLAKVTDIEERIKSMDDTGIDAQVISVVPTQYYYWAEPTLADDLAVAVNEGVAAHCALRPDRCVGLGVVPLQHPDRAVRALENAVVTNGLRGVEIGSFAPNPDGGAPIELSDPRLDPFWARAAELDAIVFLHPSGSTMGARLEQWLLFNIVGQPTEHTVALSHVIFSGVLDRHPGLRLLAAHGGGYLPTYIGRADHGWRTVPEAHGCERLPSSYLSDLYYDSLVYSGNELGRLVEVVGAERVMLGSDFPFDMGSADPYADLLEAKLSEDVTAVIATGNARLLDLIPKQTLQA